MRHPAYNHCSAYAYQCGNYAIGVFWLIGGLGTAVGGAYVASSKYQKVPSTIDLIGGAPYLALAIGSFIQAKNHLSITREQAQINAHRLMQNKPLVKAKAGMISVAAIIGYIFYGLPGTGFAAVGLIVNMNLNNLQLNDVANYIANNYCQRC